LPNLSVSPIIECSADNDKPEETASIEPARDTPAQQSKAELVLSPPQSPVHICPIEEADASVVPTEERVVDRDIQLFDMLITEMNATETVEAAVGPLPTLEESSLSLDLFDSENEHTESTVAQIVPPSQKRFLIADPLPANLPSFPISQGDALDRIVIEPVAAADLRSSVPERTDPVPPIIECPVDHDRPEETAPIESTRDAPVHQSGAELVLSPPPSPVHVPPIEQEESSVLPTEERVVDCDIQLSDTLTSEMNATETVEPVIDPLPTLQEDSLSLDLVGSDNENTESTVDQIIPPSQKRFLIADPLPPSLPSFPISQGDALDRIVIEPVAAPDLPSSTTKQPDPVPPIIECSVDHDRPEETVPIESTRDAPVHQSGAELVLSPSPSPVHVPPSDQEESSVLPTEERVVDCDIQLSNTLITEMNATETVEPVIELFPTLEEDSLSLDLVGSENENTESTVAQIVPPSQKQFLIADPLPANLPSFPISQGDALERVAAPNFPSNVAQQIDPVPPDVLTESQPIRLLEETQMHVSPEPAAPEIGTLHGSDSSDLDAIDDISPESISIVAEQEPSEIVIPEAVFTSAIRADDAVDGPSHPIEIANTADTEEIEPFPAYIPADGEDSDRPGSEAIPALSVVAESQEQTPETGDENQTPSPVVPVESPVHDIVANGHDSENEVPQKLPPMREPESILLVDADSQSLAEGEHPQVPSPVIIEEEEEFEIPAPSPDSFSNNTLPAAPNLPIQSDHDEDESLRFSPDSDDLGEPPKGSDDEPSWFAISDDDC
jgi:hypothetical protein